MHKETAKKTCLPEDRPERGETWIKTENANRSGAAGSGTLSTTHIKEWGSWGRTQKWHT